MARLESIAVAGYYPTPPHLVPRIARLLRVERRDQQERYMGHDEFTLCDPCAGDGAAVIALATMLFAEVKGKMPVSYKLYACELEKSRFAALEAQRGKKDGIPWAYLDGVHGDAFRVDANGTGVGLLYLNPPYDTDPEHGRLEQRFLLRFTAVVQEGGVLVFVVPFYALKACAATLAKEYRDIACFRFPGSDFDIYKQVVLVATKREGLFDPDADELANVLGWAKSADALPELAEADMPVAAEVPSGGRLSTWQMAPLDITTLRGRFKPWHVTDRGGRATPITGVLPEGVEGLLRRTYPVAMPPRPAHIAAGIAAGVFNGARIEPDDPACGLPPLLVKGAFDREFITIEEKENKDGDKTGEIQVQQPKLIVTVLDLTAKKYVTVKGSASVTGTRNVAEMTTADLLTEYGRALMRVMLQQCPVLHDPTDPAAELPLPALSRPLFGGQRHPVMATIKLLGGLRATRAERRCKAAFLLGEIGSGKSTVALAAARAIKAKRVLVMCPPHLLDGWAEQALAVLGAAADETVYRLGGKSDRFMFLRTIEDVDTFARIEGDQQVIAVMSREAAKLGHAWASVGPVCPKCGALVPGGDLAKTRARCGHSELRVGLVDKGRRDRVARVAFALARLLLPVAPASASVTQFVQGRHGERLRYAYRKRLAADTGELDEKGREAHADKLWRARAHRARRIALLLADDLLCEDDHHRDSVAFALLMLLAAINDEKLTSYIAEELYERASHDTTYYGVNSKRRDTARRAAMLLDPKGVEHSQLVMKLRAMPQDKSDGYGWKDPWDEWSAARADIASGRTPQSWQYREFRLAADGRAFGQIEGEAHPIGSLAGAVAALEKLTTLGRWARTRPCRTPLYSAIPEPRRVPLAHYLTKRYPDAADLLILDEGHEYAGDGSAQGFAAHRITQLGIPTIMLTGSVMNGYAESLFANQWAMDPEFRQEFGRDERGEFVRRYGYLRQLVQDFDKDGKVVSFGAVTERVERRAKTIGNAPGVLPLFILRYLLRRAVTLQKRDLALDLPKCIERVERIEPSKVLRERYERLQKALVTAIKSDRFSERAGKLWGQMSELPSYLDRATSDVGNCEDGSYTIAYPETVEHGGIVASEQGLDPKVILPKEQWMLDTIEEELGEDRNVLIFAWHVMLLPRLARLVKRMLGEECPILDASKVAAGKRLAWINTEIIKKRRRVMVVNPVAVQTGLNNLVHFNTELWMQNPGVNAIVYRQATGRVDRVGAKKETRILFPVYKGTAQEQAHKLLLHKVGVSMATDGLDAESALAAAGVGSNSGFDAMSVGRQLYELIVAESGGRGAWADAA